MIGAKLRGHLEVITGPMFSGKSEELLRRIRRLQIANQKVGVFKPIIDDRYEEGKVASHDGRVAEAFPIHSAKSMPRLISEWGPFDVVAIDEAQFFDEKLLEIINNLIYFHDVRVIVSGLDQDFRQEPFGIMPQLLSMADFVVKLKAICNKCGADATTTQRLTNGKPASYSGETILVGAKDTYEARCRTCHERG